MPSSIWNRNGTLVDETDKDHLENVDDYGLADDRGGADMDDGETAETTNEVSHPDLWSLTQQNRIVRSFFLKPNTMKSAREANFFQT